MIPGRRERLQLRRAGGAGGGARLICGGLPVGAYGGRREIMERVAPLGDMYQAGTLSGNPLAVSAGVATLTELQRPGVYEQLDRLAARLTDRLSAAFRDAEVPEPSTPSARCSPASSTPAR